MGGVGYFSAVSNVVQHMLAEVFNDEPFMEQYFAENSRRLGAAYAEFTGERCRSLHCSIRVQTCSLFRLHLTACSSHILTSRVSQTTRARQRPRKLEAERPA